MFLLWLNAVLQSETCHETNDTNGFHVDKKASPPKLAAATMANKKYALFTVSKWSDNKLFWGLAERGGKQNNAFLWHTTHKYSQVRGLLLHIHSVATAAAALFYLWCPIL